jgi:hypothetical protein
MIAATILLTLAVTLFIGCIVGSIIDIEHWLLGLGITITGIFSFVGIGLLYATPTNKDVREGEAHYIEQNHIEIVNGDTVNNYKTYEIIWNQN